MLGGVGLFLYGMKLMGQSLERFAGAKMEKTLEKLTSNRGKGVLLGAGVTAVIQSSSATIIMVIGFLNAGILKLMQAVPIIMGANIGTTITAQILRLGDINNDNLILQMLKPASFAPICVVIGAFVMLISKKNKTKDKAGIAVGLGILFIGMSMMESSFKPLASSPEFMELFLVLTNPVLGVLAGMCVTVLLQSSSASVGVLQAMSATGAITFSMAAPIVIGQNIGKCVTVLLASIGTNKNSRRAVCIDITMSIAGAILFLTAIYLYQGIIGFSFWDEPVNRGRIADFHTLFNLVTCIVMLPCINILITFAKKVVKDKNVSKIDEELALLDPIFIQNPSVALEQCKKVMVSMTDAVMENYKLCTACLYQHDPLSAEKIRENESFLDKTESVLGEYLVKITEQHLVGEDNRLATEFMHTVGDFERIGDHCMNLLEVSEYNMEQEIGFSKDALFELNFLSRAVGEALDTTVTAYQQEKESVCHKIGPLEDVVDDMVDTLKSKRIIRLQTGACTTEGGISYIEVLTNMERISDHCINISMHLHQRIIRESLDTHKSEVFDREADEYKAMKVYYEKQYLDPVK
ncbi:Na/Pi cotransporter family protein [Emergencia timonensis]|uniref:Na/Pi cotransporter family protein n=2 Tax=Emergencia timonensis TaxID=1776384 RepID=A0A415E3F9_9FIRM|nr:Na/Pi cotransporter family protein [Emergencia timonensis]RHJ88150.1 Na/Pi cotransporter family protein [Emergencia timonensis]